MADRTVLQNIKSNSRPLLIILVAASVFGAFTIKQAPSRGAEVAAPPSLTIGFYRKGYDGERFFAPLWRELAPVLDEYYDDVQSTGLPNIAALCDALAAGEIDIAGELSPIQYVDNHGKCGFEVLIALEYEGRSFYRAVFFSGKRKEHFERPFVPEPGRDILGYIKALLAEAPNKKAWIAILDDENSTSGHYYPQSYMLEHDIDLSALQMFETNEKIYQEVLKKRNDNPYLGGFLADFRYDRFVAKPPFSDPDAFVDPFIIDKSDPIPNGVFVISKSTLAKKGLNLAKLVRLWKTVSGITVNLSSGGGPEITGWRTGAERDLALVEFHKKRVDYHGVYTEDYPFVLATTIAVSVILLSALGYFYLRRWGR